ncbi:hypothetical protein FO519_010076 [Halicephalobus sp. NKZ332]|nr:hypothetical protein FO519_010076 [Halicephalobus sp. NKZ332]
MKMICWYSIAVLFAALQLTFASESIEYFVGERDGKSYTITEYYETPNRLVLNVNESSGIVKYFNLSICDEWVVKINNYSIDNQGRHLYIHIWDADTDDSLISVNLTALSNNISNGNCISIADSYFGKHKIYIYRVEEEQILKRWLVTPDGEIANPVVVKKTKFPIRHVDINSKLIQITTREENSRSSEREDCEDLPRCDVPENDTSCEEYRDAGKISEILSTTERVEASVILFSKRYLKVIIIAICALLFILTLLGIGCCFYKWKLKSIHQPLDHPKSTPVDYVLIPCSTLDADGYKAMNAPRTLSVRERN